MAFASVVKEAGAVKVSPTFNPLISIALAFTELTTPAPVWATACCACSVVGEVAVMN